VLNKKGENHRQRMIRRDKINCQVGNWSGCASRKKESLTKTSVGKVELGERKQGRADGKLYAVIGD